MRTRIRIRTCSYDEYSWRAQRLAKALQAVLSYGLRRQLRALGPRYVARG